MRSNKLLKLFLIVLALALAAALAAAAGCKKNNEEQADATDQPIDVISTPAPDATETAEPEPTATPVPEFTDNVMPGRDGSVCAIETGTYGVATDGSIRFMGRTVSGQHLIWEWSDVVQVAASNNTTVALLGDGTLRMTGTHAAEFEAANEWTDIVAVSVGEAHLVGLHADGTVSAVGDNTNGQLNVEGWSRVKCIAAVNNFTVALTDIGGDGLLDTLHGSVPIYGMDDSEFTAMVAADDHVALLTEDGRVFTYQYGRNASASRDDDRDPAVRLGLEDSGWSSISKVFAAEGATYGLGPNGELYSMGENALSSNTEGMRAGVYTLSATKDNLVLLNADGTVEAFGNNDYLQCNVGVWRLLPYVTEDGYLLGYTEGDIVNGEEYRTGLALNFADPVTGEISEVTAVLLGDLNGDGAIDTADQDIMTKYRNGDTELLEGAFLRAANIIDDDNKPGTVDRVDSDALNRHLRGDNPIDQYAKKDMYTTPLANAKRVNLDALGYIKIENTNINYPIMYGDNWYYHTRGLDGSYIERGSLYYYWSKPGKNIVVTGHNARTSGTMFHQLHYVQNRSEQLIEYANRLWCINTFGETGYWEVWAMYEEGAFSNPDNSSLVYNTCYPRTMESMNEQEQQGWIFYQIEKNALRFKVNVTTEDRFMTLVTCGDTHADSERGSRLYFFLRWVGGN